MSIEAHLAALTEALNKNTETLLKMTGAAPSTTTAPATSGKGKKATADDDKKAVTQEQMNAALIKVKDDFGMAEAKAIIKEVGKADKMAEIKPAQYQAVHDAAIKRHEELSAGKGGGTSGDDDI